MLIPMTKSALEAHFKPGNIIRSDYWGAHDLVIKFDWNGGSWMVTVRNVALVDGEWQLSGPRRIHCTHPDTKDRVVRQS